MTGLTVMVPSRNRPHTVHELWKSFRETTTNIQTELLFIVDRSDPTYAEYEKAVDEYGDQTNLFLYESTVTGMVAALNERAVAETELARILPFHFGFMGDDHRPRTKGWDQDYLDAIKDGALVVYGNDLLQGRAMPTQVALNWKVVDALGYMAPPQFFHLCIDLVWKDWGDKTNRIKYLPDTIVEHLHPAASKAAYDADYDRVNNPSVVESDAKLYYDYRDNGGLEADVAKLMRIPR